MPNHDYDDLFDQWGAALNVNPQLGKTIFHIESDGNPNVGNSTAGAVGPMQIMPATGALMAKKMGFDPKAVDLHDMGWAVPLAMQYIADGLTATGSADGAAGYYESGSTDPKRWNRGYIDKLHKLYPSMSLTPQPQQAQEDGRQP